VDFSSDTVIPIKNTELVTLGVSQILERGLEPLSLTASGGFRGGRTGSAAPFGRGIDAISLMRSSHHVVICTYGHVRQC